MVTFFQKVPKDRISIRVVRLVQIQKKLKNYSTTYSRPISDDSTDVAITSLTSEIERDPVLSGMDDRS